MELNNQGNDIIEKMMDYVQRYRITKFKLTLRQLNLIDTKEWFHFPTGLTFCRIDVVEVKEKEDK